ncbi:MAG: lipoyl(octanoyl) transferase LipB [Candidatus Abyssobacteria bacterium SURF_17]|uniref:Octanoyltransferase n=1 Tax=Candidatus Abyssobacteria bacterium SURF_17 TaxID=2093361 RepID=A0A419ESS4_9BACT|nr:MAG: lipoyl(octanoyl) transferase LipB [Candidatus Abyssubacteria bacterium SURF_17]
MVAGRKDEEWLLFELPVTDYMEAWNLQRALVAGIVCGRIHHNVILSLQHSSVFTLGRSSGRESLRVSENVLEKSGIPLVQTERGGSITFHGPGQLVVYPIINLEAFGIRVGEYVYRLEEAMIRTAADWNISAERNRLNAGVWVGRNKLGSVGLTIRHGISFHGLALNISNSLQAFSWINPCGLNGVGVTSIERELSRDVSFHTARRHMMRHIEEVFDVRLVRTDMAELQNVLDGSPSKGACVTVSGGGKR